MEPECKKTEFEIRRERKEGRKKQRERERERAKEKYIKVQMRELRHSFTKNRES